MQDGRSVNFIEGCEEETLWNLLNLFEFEFKVRVEFAVRRCSFLRRWTACNSLLQYLRRVLVIMINVLLFSLSLEEHALLDFFEG